VIPHITRGGDTRGVVAYLLGKGWREEHVDPHLVAGSAEAVMLAGGRLLERRDVGPLAGFLDEPREVFGTRVTIAERDQDGNEVGRREAHVWHCSLALHPDEPALSDARWGQLADRFIGEMRFAGDDVGAPCRWVGVRHGRSTGGSDHVHLVVVLVAEDGSRASVHNDRLRAQSACRALECEFGLREIEARSRGAGERAVEPGELEGDLRRGLDVGERREHPERGSRRTLERVVRACGAAARDEPEFVARLRAEGLLVRPRYASQSTSEVVGYSVALRPTMKGQGPVWYGGGRLSRELTLPRLRENWLETDNAAVADAWQAGATSGVGPRRARTRRAASREVQERCASELAALRERLLEIPADDTATWAHAAREAAGVFAAWSLRTEPAPGPLAETSRVLARSAQLRRREVGGRRWRSLPAARYTSALLLAATPEARTALLIFRQLAGLSTAIADMHQAVGELDRARELRELSRRQLASVTAELQAREVRAHTAAAGGPVTVPQRRAGSPTVRDDRGEDRRPGR
jgi:hypothetical protein